MENKGKQSKKRILMLNYEFPPLGGGGGVAAKKLAEGFVELGYEVDYVTTWFKGLKKFEKVNGINVYRVKVIGRKELPTATMISMLSFPISAYSLCSNLCNTRKYDLLISYFAVPSGTLGRILSKKYKIKHVVNIVGGDIYDPTKKLSPHRNYFFRNEVRRVLNSADLIASISTDTKKRAINYYGINKKIEVIPIPYKLFKFKNKNRKQMGLSKSIFYTISIGRLVKRKGFDFLIRSISKTSNDIHAIIIGDGPKKQDLMNLAEKLEIRDRIHFVGSVSEERKFQYLSNSDVYILSSVHEGFGIVLQEAMQVGLPIISTDNGGQVDLVQDGKNGYLIKFGDENKLVTNLYRMLKQKNKFSKANILKSKEFEIKKVANSYFKVLK